MFLHHHQDSYLMNNGNQELHLAGSQRDVISYRCGACGYELNLSSSNRNTSTIGSKYGKSMKKGIISFFSVDESRFEQVDHLRCIPFFISKHSWGLLRHKTKLLCRKCGNHVGNAYEEKSPPGHVGSDSSDSGLSNEISICRKYDVKIRALQPSEEEPGIFL